MKDVSMYDIKKAVGNTDRNDFIRFGIKDYKSLYQRASRLVGKLRGKHIWTYTEYMEELIKLAELIYPD